MEFIKGKKYTWKEKGINITFEEFGGDGKEKYAKFTDASGVPVSIMLEFDGKNIDKIVEEFDPTKGIKNTGKLEWHYVPPQALEDTVRVLNYGAKKYAKNNWRLVPNREEMYYDAIQRHIMKWLNEDEVEDKETKLSHWAHVACCAWFMYEFERDNITKGKNKWGK